MAEVNEVQTPAKIIGGPEDNSGAVNPMSTTAAPPSQPVVAPAAATPVASTTPIIIGDRVFTDRAEADKFANDLAAERHRFLTNYQPNAQPIAPAPTQTKIPIHQLMFEDPEAAIRELRADLKAEINSDITKTQSIQNIWTEFYNSNKDLQGLEDAVDFVRQKNWGKIEKLSVTEGMKYIAAESRNYVAKIRGTANTGERVNSGPAMVAGSTGSPAPSVVVQASKPSTFTDELRDYRNSKMTKQKQGKGA